MFAAFILTTLFIIAFFFRYDFILAFYNETVI